MSFAAALNRDITAHIDDVINSDTISSAGLMRPLLAASRNQANQQVRAQWPLTHSSQPPHLKKRRSGRSNSASEMQRQRLSSDGVVGDTSFKESKLGDTQRTAGNYTTLLIRCVSIMQTCIRDLRRRPLIIALVSTECVVMEFGVVQLLQSLQTTNDDRWPALSIASTGYSCAEYAVCRILTLHRM